MVDASQAQSHVKTSNPPITFGVFQTIYLKRIIQSYRTVKAVLVMFGYLLINIVFPIVALVVVLFFALGKTKKPSNILKK